MWTPLWFSLASIDYAADSVLLPTSTKATDLAISPSDLATYRICLLPFALAAVISFNRPRCSNGLAFVITIG